MRVSVRLFARLREAAGRDGWDAVLPAGATVGDVWSAVTRECPALEPFSSSLSAAVNADFARLSAPVHDGDEVAFLPPVSGGAGWEPASG